MDTAPSVDSATVTIAVQHSAQRLVPSRLPVVVVTTRAVTSIAVSAIDHTYGDAVVRISIPPKLQIEYKSIKTQ